MRFGVSQRRLWVNRLPPRGEVFDPALERASVDRMLGALLERSDAIIAAHGGAVALLVNPLGEPREMVLEHGVLSRGLDPSPIS